jgi:hypothetical protein
MVGKRNHLLKKLWRVLEMGAESEKQNNDKEKCAVFEFDLIVSCKRYDMNKRITPTQNKL